MLHHGGDQTRAPYLRDTVLPTLSEISSRTVHVSGWVLSGFSELVGQFLRANKDPRKVVADTHALYFGVELNDQSLVPGDNPRIGAKRFDDWLSQSTRQK